MIKDPNRKTGIPVKGIPSIVEWLLKNCTQEEIVFMADLASKRRNFQMLNSIFTRLTDYNLHQVFYTNVKTSEELNVFRASKRGEVAGLKAFSLACQEAHDELERRKES